MHSGTTSRRRSQPGQRRRSGAAAAARDGVGTGSGAGGGPLRVLCVHGVGDHHSDTTWQADWGLAIRNAVARFAPQRSIDVQFLMYDHIFEKPAYQISPAMVASAVWKLSVSGIVNGVADLFRRRRGLADISARMRWTAGMVVQWADKPQLRAETRAALGARIEQFQPDVICAHSLGSLVTYDTLVRDAGPALAAGRRLMTFGSQIGNPFVRNTFGGRIVQPGVDFWYHLFNRNDDVFAAEVRLPPTRFVQVETEFELPGIGDHDAVSYLSHERAADRAWREIAGGATFAPIARAFGARTAPPGAARKANRKALLVGINDYPNPEDRLEGCVNDVFTMSALLQEIGFLPEDIRVVLDDRATAAGIRERLASLLEGVADDPGEERFFYYSGHGAQIPAYGEGDKTDHLDECLVPYDFDWSEERAVTDDFFFELYSQLPYQARFVAVFDCCHSGGMTRAGGARVRGLAPPDDIRHRAMIWNADLEMWESRDLPAANVDLEGDKQDDAAYVGESGAKHRLGRAIPLRRLGDKAYDAERKSAGHRGPYMPIIIQACRENELSYEYRHGVASHGAFTFSLDRALREASRGGGGGVSFEALVAEVGKRLEQLRYDQTPCIVGPKPLVKARVPWAVKARRTRKGTGGGVAAARGGGKGGSAKPPHQKE